jgi:hypothetical protein
VAVIAGLAKGGHQDRDDFYKRIERENEIGDPARSLPSEQDIRLLKQETASRLRTEWELNIQRTVLGALCTVHAGGGRRIDIHHPVPGHGLVARVDLTMTPVREDGYEADEVVVEIIAESRYSGTELLWQLTVRVLISLEPPEQGWDRLGNTFSNIGEPGAWTQRTASLAESGDANELELSQPGSTSHYTHREHLAGRTINGNAVRALCGAFFVPTQDHGSMPVCATCEEGLAELPG